MDIYRSLLTVTLASLPIVAVYAYRTRLMNILLMAGLFVVSMAFVPATDYIFESVLKPHQQERILSYLGIVDKPQGIDYNVNQSKIAIGSGGLFGKGFLQGTQIKYNVAVLGVMCLLLLRLMKMGERQEEPFGRVYCYSVAAILLFHVLVNVGMTIGLMPVMGIQLPFMSYGGSSLLAFTILLFIAIRLDASTRQFPST